MPATLLLPRSQDCDAYLVSPPRLSTLKWTVLESARASLKSRPYRALWSVECELDGSVLVLKGVVQSYFLKQLAQAAVSEIRGVERIANNIVVRYPLTPVSGGNSYGSS
jgi:hypothetical protein